ncbi:heat repeat-containing protein : Putative uncharacterized protein OS=[Oscillatoria] sp. PCC 6506 GN=OSCI_440025 PE=4 SV=1: HEAT_2 [Tuwongella immobilis]|uniref:HEAT repeat domain-containing protein n=2 Tax=Tuwongella immobilis TaxID=692036 RepID=A0A6C2YKG9_9BACT|nr:heat repeat-containing protein : Putative uncharacterized protein OS=[Oscillatoria] sp. PCC 6506 GN=OSCI_440025 PE=4 SV=1: HEAT_2 [Tuwongella immobilis]VTR99680.1 heat repeat-containing protein : Putative uncharacterized protein OS=[Oscillatoria] sp. PCC 6506 GN=OSCI_440025 PE=4 SV=1: HEAT_2 [Tuwongella immobilis]
MPWLIRILAKKPSSYLRWQTLTFPITRVAMRGLVTLGDVSASAIEPLISTRNVWLRLNAARALGAIGEQSRSVTPSLIRMTRDPDAWIRAQSCFGLGRSRVADADVIPTLSDRMEDPDRCVRAEAWNAFQQFGVNPNESGKKLVSELVLDLRESDHHQCARTAITLSHFGEVAEEAFPSLLQLLTQDCDWTVELSIALACIAMWNKSQIKLLVDGFLRCANPVHGFWFLATLGEIVQRHGAEMPSFQREFGRSSSSTSCHPSEIVEEAKQVIQPLISRISDQKITGYLSFLPRLGADLSQARSVLEHIIFGKYDPESRASAIRSLVALSASARDGFVTLDPILLKLIDDPAHQVRLAARSSLVARAISERSGR